MEKLALQFDGAAAKKLSVQALEAEKAAKDGLKDVAVGAHALADKLREDGHGELADMQHGVSAQVRTVLSDSHTHCLGVLRRGLLFDPCSLEAPPSTLHTPSWILQDTSSSMLLLRVC